ncbi:hypothetical protein ACHAXT_008473 [Thalassiosira profunda]
MSYCKASAIAEASPATIWTTCFESMQWELWDANLLRLEDVSGPCADGTTCTFVQRDGRRFAFELSDVVPERSLTFGGTAIGGAIRAEGRIKIERVDNFQTKVQYSFELSGLGGYLVGLLRQQDVVEGTERGLAKIVELSEEAQGSETFTLN